MLRWIAGREITVHSDDHRAYPVAIRRLAARVHHCITPGGDHRGIYNRLFAINLLDLLIRHGQGAHKRETIAFAKRLAGAAERLAIFLLWRNYIKGRREKQRGSPTPAMCRGLARRPLKVSELLKRRLFFDHIKLPERWRLYYARQVPTRPRLTHRTHTLKYAY